MPSRRLISVWFVVALALLAVACAGVSVPDDVAFTPTLSPQATETPAPSSVTELERVKVRIGELEIDAELADTQEERSLGLGERDSLAPGAGMLFVFQEESLPAFCMCRMRFGLDFIWISGESRVVDLTLEVPAPAPDATNLPSLRPIEPVLYILEVNAGVIREAGVSVGDEVVIEPDIRNLLSNGSFEEGRDPWFSKTDSWGTDFSVSDQQARSGANSALLELRSDGEADSVRVYGVVQEMTPQAFPQVVSGYYYVERWEQGTPHQYLQFVVIVHDAENIPPGVASGTNHQIRYVLAGAESQPTFIGNARYVMVTRSEPKMGEWVAFEFNIREDFQALWGDVPQGYQKLAFFFETRWDGRQPSDGPSEADVYYDDLYIGGLARGLAD